ncbi:MAG: helix-turn-helix domain-containing protein [Theionarchaea archaeon]|nr:helix-turn-helix domain-containing protein [Theionarchaea archaeon]
MERIRLDGDEVEYLKAFVKKGRKSARELTRARILLLINEGKTEMEIRDILGISRATVSNIKKRYREEGLYSAFTEKGRVSPKYTKKHEAEIITLACTTSSHGRKRWSLTLLAEELKKKEGFNNTSGEYLPHFKKSKTKPWLRKMWCTGTIDTSFRARMYDIPHLYEEPYDSKRTLVTLGYDLL